MPPPPNDNLVDAIEISLGDTVTGTTVDATLESVDEDDWFSSTPTVYYKLVLETAAYVKITLSGEAGWRPYMETFRSILEEEAPPTLWGWDQIDTGNPWAEAAPGGAPVGNLNAMAVGTWYFAVLGWEFDGGTGDFEFKIEEVQPDIRNLDDENSSSLGSGSGQIIPFRSWELYWLRLGKREAPGQVDFDIRKAIQPPLYDDFLSYADIQNPAGICQFTIGDNAPFTNRNATAEVGEPAHAGFPAKRSVWFQWTPAGGVQWDLRVEGDDDDFVVAVYQGADFASLVELASDDNSGPGGVPFVQFTTDGEPIWVVVDSKGQGAEFRIAAEVTSATRPANNDFADREVLPGTSGTVTGTLIGSTYECGSPLVPGGFSGTQFGIGGDIWYEFTPTGPDYTLSWEVDDPVRITVYYDMAPLDPPQFGQLVPYPGFNVSGTTGPFQNSGSITFGVTPGTTYYVRVEQRDNVQGNIEWSWDEPVNDDGGDNIEDAPDVVVGPGGGLGGDYDYDTTGGTQQPNEPLDTPGEVIRSVWRKFTPEHDCTYWTRYNTGTFGQQQPAGERLDFWRGTTLGNLELLPCQGPTLITVPGGGNAFWYAVRMKKDETYMIRHSVPVSKPATSGTMTVIIDYEMDVPWTDADLGFDVITGDVSFEDPWPEGGGVTTFSYGGQYLEVTPWVGDRAAYHSWVSCEVRVTADFSPTAADGPVLGRHGGPSIYYPYPGGSISIARLTYSQGQPGGTSVFYLRLAGDLNGTFNLDLWNGLGGGSAYVINLMSNFAAPNSETEGGEWIPIELTPQGVYVHGRCVYAGNVTQWLSKVEFGAILFPVDTFWGAGGPLPKDPPYGPPEDWTLQLRRMRITDRVADGPRMFYNDLPGDNDQIQNHMVEWDSRIGVEDNVGMAANPLAPTFGNAGSGGTPDPATLNEPNPGTRTWDVMRIHDQSYFTIINHPDNPRRHSGFWIWFDEFPNGGDPNPEVVIAAMAAYSGTSFGYFNDLGRLVVDANGILWIYPNRNWRKQDTATFGNQGWIYDTGNRKYQIGTLALQTWYWIEQLTDNTWPWDVVCRVAVNEVECQAEYHSILHQSLGNVATARYQGSVFPLNISQQQIGVPSGAPNPFGQPTYFNGAVDVSMGPWMVGRGGLLTYVGHRNEPDADLSQPLQQPGVGAHAGAMVPVNDDDGTHKLIDIDDCDPWEFDGPEDAPMFEYGGVRMYKGSKSRETSPNHDMSGGVSGYHKKNIGSQPSLDPVIVSDGSGPVIGPYDYSGEDALKWEGDPSGPGDTDFSGWDIGDDYSYIGVRPPDGVREGGDPNDDGGDHYIVVLFIRAPVGSPSFTAFDEIRGLNARGPSYGLTSSWVRIYGQTYPNNDLTSGPANGVWRWENFHTAGAYAVMKHVRTFKNPMVYPRFKTTTDNGVTSTWIEHADDPVAAFLNDDPLEATDMGVFLDNVCSFGRHSRTGTGVPGLLGDPPTGLSMGDYRPRYYVEVKPPTEPELEETNLQIASLRVMVRGAGYGSGGAFGEITTARTSGTLKVRMVGGTHRLVVADFGVSSTDRAYRSQVLPMTPMAFGWQTDRVAETKIRMGYHFNYTDLINSTWGFETRQSGGAICKSLAYEVFCKVTPGPPICGGMRWNSRQTHQT